MRLTDEQAEILTERAHGQDPLDSKRVKSALEAGEEAQTNSETHTPDEPVHRDPEAFAWEGTF